jgi:hypothetical protein
MRNRTAERPKTRRFYVVKGGLEISSRAAVEVASERALDAATCFSGGLARGEEPLVVGGGLPVVAGSVAERRRGAPS